MSTTDVSSFSVPHRSITPERRAIYLKVLAETGSHPAAARAASPHLADSPGPRPGYSSFADLRRTDPDFAAACREAEQQALGRVEAEIVRRSFELDRRPIFDRAGRQIGEQVDSRPANQLLLRLAERLDPSWAPKKNATVDATHTHEHHHRHEHEVVFALRPEHLALLPEDRRRRFVDDLRTIRAALERQEAPEHERRLPAPAGPAAGALRGEAAPAGDDAGRADRADR